MGRVGRTVGPYEKNHTIRLWGKFFVGTTLTDPSSPTITIHNSDTTTPTRSYTGAYYYDWTIPNDGTVETEYVVKWWGALSATDVGSTRYGRTARTVYKTEETQP